MAAAPSCRSRCRWPIPWTGEVAGIDRLCDDDGVTPSTGRLLIATPNIGDSIFSRSVVLLLDHGDEGSAGVILNHPTNLTVEELDLGLDDAVSQPAVVFDGGPVERHGLLGVTRDADGSPRPADLDLEVADLVPLRLFAGYAGWAPGQLDGEIEDDAWWVVDRADVDVLDGDPADLWFRLVARFDDRRSWLRTVPDDPAVN